MIAKDATQRHAADAQIACLSCNACRRRRFVRAADAQRWADNEGTMTSTRHQDPTLERDGWQLVSAEVRNAAHPETFQIPMRDRRMSLVPGDAVKLLFHIETREAGRIIDRGVDRMWVIVRADWDGRYVGVLDSDPGEAEGLLLHLGDEIVLVRSMSRTSSGLRTTIS